MASLEINRSFPIYNADGTRFHNLELRKAVVDSVVMSLSDKITGEVYYKDNSLEFTMQEYVEYQRSTDEEPVKYYLVNPPTLVREGMVSDNSDLKGMSKYSFEFYHPMYMLGNFPFTDVAVSSDEKKYLSESKEFSWIGKPADYVAKINKNLEGTEWVVVLSDRFPEGLANQLSDVLKFDKNTIADALKTGYDTWKVPFVIDSLHQGEYYNASNVDYYSAGGGSKRYVILFGLPSNEIYVENDGVQTPFVFRFGKGVGLKNNSRNPKNNKIVTRIAGYGSENNIPYGYPQVRWYGDPRWEYTEYDGATINYNSDGKVINTPKAGAYPLYKGIVGGAYVTLIKHPFTRSHLMPSIYTECVFNKVSPYLSNGNANPDYDPDLQLVDYYDAISDSEVTYINEINPSAPSYEIHEFDVKPELRDGEEKTIIQVIPLNNDLTVADGWDDSIDDEGNFKQSYFRIVLPALGFDLYACASITEEMQINIRSGACLGCTFNVQVDWDDYKKNFYDSDGNFDPVIGSGHPRNATKYPNSTSSAISLILQKENSTFGTIMPNIYQYPSTGDAFVILGISLPLSYITNAESRLDNEMKSFMLENNVHYFDYPLKFDEHFLTTHEDILKQITTNTVVQFGFEGESQPLELFVKQLTVKYGEGVLPKYDITLTDNVEVVLNQIGKVADDVERLAALISILRQSYNKNVWIELEKKLSKAHNDATPYTLTAKEFVATDDVKTDRIIARSVLQAIVFGSNIQADGQSLFKDDVTIGTPQQTRKASLDVYGVATLRNQSNRVVGSAEFGASSSSDETHYDKNVKGCKIYWDAVGKGWMIETDYLHVNKRMYARSIQVDEVTHVGGENILTDAACVADMVFPCDEYGHFITDNVTPISFYRVFFKKKNGEGRTIYNKFRVGDQGYCQVFNIDTGVTENFCNKYYWRLVTGTSNPCTIDEETGLYNFLGTGLFYDQDTEAYIEDYHFIDLSYSDCDTPTTNISGMSMLSQADAAMTAAATPQAEDPIIQFGYREQSGDDANFVAERQGATLISGGGSWKRAIVMWEGIGANSSSYYSLPSPRVVLSPNGIDMTVDTLRIKTTGGSQTIAQHVADTLESFRIFEMETSDVPSLSIEPFRSWSTEERVKYSTPPNNAIVLNIDGRTWRFVYDAEHETYGFEEFTDPWLLAQHKTISDMLDDDVVEAKELSELDRIVSELEDEEDRVEAEFDSTGAAGTGNATEDAYDAWQDAWSTLIELLTGITQETPPVYLYGYNGANAGSVTTIESSRSDIKAALLAHTSALYAWQSAFAAYRLSNIGTAAAEQAMQTAQQYIENKLDEIIQNVTDAHIDSLIEEYVNDVTKFPYTQIEANRTGLQAVTNWVGTDSASMGSAGIMTYLSQMFVGTSSMSFKTDSEGNVVIGEDGKPIITSFDKAGLATDNDFASLFVSRNDLATNASVSARITAFITTMNTQFTRTNGRIAAIEEGRTVIDIKADHVIIESVGSGVEGKPLSYSFYLDAMGNMIMQDLWAKNITVEGVINNLVNDIEDGDTNNDKLIPADLKSSNSNDILHAEGIDLYPSSCYCLDVLRLGDVIRITKCDRPYILLPFYVHEYLLARTATLYGGTMHRITLTEMRQLLGRKITIFVEQDAFGNSVFPKILIPTILGDENNNNVDIVEDVVKLLPNNSVVLKYDNNVVGLSLFNGCAVTLEFKHGYCKETRDGLEAFYPIYYWAISHVSTEAELTGWYDETDDEMWSDTFDEEEEEV